MKAVESPAGAGRAKSRERAGLERGVWELLSELHLLQKPRLMALCREFDLFPPQLLVLKTLDHPRPMREVAATMGCDSSNLTGITDRLEERGLVVRTADPDDRRVKLLVLTDEGKRLRRQVTTQLGQPPAGTVDTLSDRELTQLQRLLAKALG